MHKVIQRVLEESGKRERYLKEANRELSVGRYYIELGKDGAEHLKVKGTSYDKIMGEKDHIEFLNEVMDGSEWSLARRNLDLCRRYRHRFRKEGWVVFEGMFDPFNYLTKRGSQAFRSIFKQ